MHDFLTDRKSLIFGVWAALGGRETLQKGGGRSSLPFVKVSRPPGAVQIPKIDDFRSVRKSGTKNQGVTISPFKGPRGPFKGPLGPLKGPRGPLKGPLGPLKGPRGPSKGPRVPLKGSRGALKGPRP